CVGRFAISQNNGPVAARLPHADGTARGRRTFHAPSVERAMMDDFVAADEVIGTEVFNAEGRKLGRIRNIMIDKLSGEALYAVMCSGGMLGIGETYYPVPWAKLKYDEAVRGYIVDEAVLRLQCDRHGHTDMASRRPESDSNHQILE